MGSWDHFTWSLGRLLQGKKQYASRGAYEREEQAKAAERRGDHGQARLYRACLCQSEWHALGYDGSFGNYRKVRKGESLYEATNGAYGKSSELDRLKRILSDDPNGVDAVKTRHEIEVLERMLGE